MPLFSPALHFQLEFFVAPFHTAVFAAFVAPLCGGSLFKALLFRWQNAFDSSYYIQTCALEYSSVLGAFNLIQVIAM